MSNPEVRFIKSGEDHACNRFHNRLYNKNRTLYQWRWHFVENTYPHGQIPFAVVVDEGKIVGTQAFIPIRMIDEDGVYWTAKSEETLLEAEYRGKKYFEKMYRLLFDYAEKNDMRCIWGFTPATKALIKIGFTIPAATSQLFFPFYARSINALMKSQNDSQNQSLTKNLKFFGYRSACRIACLFSGRKLSHKRAQVRKSSALKSLELRTLDEAPDDAGDVCRRFIKRWGGKIIYRDSDYLNWRIFNNPFVKGVFRGLFEGERLLGWVIYSLDDDGVGHIIDLMVVVDDDKSYSLKDTIRLLITDAVIGTRNMGALAIRGWHVNNHPFDLMVTRVAKKAGFYHIKRGFSVVLYDSPKYKMNGLDNFDQWYVTRIYTIGIAG